MALSLREQDRRYTAIRKLMVRDGLDSLLVAGRGDYLARGNLRYITDYGVICYDEYCIFPSEGVPVFVGRDWFKKRNSEWIVEFSGDTRDPIGHVKQALVRSDKGNKVGIVGMQDVSATMYQAVHGQFGDRLVDATAIFTQLRMIKSPEEIEQMRMSAAVGDKVVTAVRDMVHPGLSDYEVYAQVKKIGYEMGCEYSFDQIAVGSMQKLFNPIGKRLEPDCPLAMYITPAYEGYFTQIAGSFPVGEYQPNMSEVLAVWKQALKAGASILRPGTKVSDVYLAVAKVSVEAGYERPSPGYASRSRRCGHGIGLALAESWYITESETTELKPGMTFALHPYITKPGGGDVLMGYTYLITDTGSERLNKVDIA